MVNCQKKKLKKKWYSFLQTFFLKSILDIFLCPISKLKKKFWKVENIPFFQLLKITIYPPKIDISYFFCWNRIFGGTFCKFTFLSWFILFYIIFYDIFVFFYFINEKIYYYKIFFHYKCSYKLSTIIQKILNFIQKLSIRSEKIPKNPEKSRKNPIFLLFFLWSHPRFCQKSTHHLTY